MDEIDFISNIFHSLAQNKPIEQRLQSALDIVRAYLPVDIASILFIPENQHDLQIISSGGEETLTSEYKEKYFFMDHDHDFPEDKAVAFHPGETDGDPSAASFKEFCQQRVGIKAVIGADFHFNKGLEARLRLVKTQGGDFTEAQTNLVSRVIPAFKNAIEQALDTQYHSLFDYSAQKVLARFRIGIYIVTKSLDVLYRSYLADQLLANSNAFNCNKNKLIAKSREYQGKFERMINDLASNSEILYRTMNIVSPRSGEQYTIAITRYDNAKNDGLLKEQCFNIFIFSSVEEKIDMGILVGLWSISPAEQRVLTAMMRFDNVKRVAIELNISPNTAKAQLKSVYKKLGIVSKTMLIKRLNSVKNMAALLS